jgi:UDP-GlcNAc:undecaprenyl-phosphate GlcNAc-1-phosphate transferase
MTSWSVCSSAAAAFGVALALCVAVTAPVRRVAVHFGVLADPGGPQLGAARVPCLGGAAVVAGVGGAGVPLAGLVGAGAAGMGFFAAAALAGVLGLVDDVRGLSPWTRLGFETALAGALWAAGFGVEWVGDGLPGLVITVLWVVGVANAVNMLDNMDGLAPGVAAIAAAAFTALGLATGQVVVAVLGAALAGGTVGFLRTNAHPARMYLGDTGSLFIGLLLAVLGARLSVDGAPYLAALVLAVPIADTLFVSMTRLARGISPLQGGTDHLSHRLVRLGLAVPAAVRVHYVVAAGCALAAMVVAL